MTKVIYQIGFESTLDATTTIDEILLDLLNQVFIDGYIEFEESEINDYVMIQYEHNFDNIDHSWVGFQLELPDEIGTNNIDIIRKFTQHLQSHNQIFVVFKFYDDSLFARLQRLYTEIFEIEMRLREVTTFIFADTYRQNYHDCLVEITINSMLEKDFKGDLEGKVNRLKARWENEFFHLNFGSYTSLTGVKPLQQTDLFPIAEQSSSFLEFKQHILQRGIQKEVYRDFLNNIKQHLAAVDKVRNCVAHNRMVSPRELSAYEQSKDVIHREIDDFFELLTTEV